VTRRPARRVCRHEGRRDDPDDADARHRRSAPEAVNAPEIPMATTVHAVPRSAAARTVKTPVARKPRPITTWGRARVGCAVSTTAPTRLPTANAVTRSAALAGEPMRSIERATAATASPPWPS
jgi:hypothetical protein